MLPGVQQPEALRGSEDESTLGPEPDAALADGDPSAALTAAEIDEILTRLRPYFDIPRLLAERRGLEALPAYFTQSVLAYFLFHSMRGAMHMALNPDGVFDPSGYEGQARIVEDHVRATQARQVLEIGCGRGFNLLALGRRNPAVTFTGIDVTPLHVRAARLLAWRRPNVRVREGDFHQLPFADGSFDLVFSVEAICHAEDVYRVGNEVWRVLRPGGRFVTIEPWRRPGFATLDAAAQCGARLVETVFILPNLQEFDRWLAETTALGFEVVFTRDATAAILPNLEKLRRQALLWRRVSWGRAAMHRLAPRLMENALAAVLMGECFRKGLWMSPTCYRIAVFERA